MGLDWRPPPQETLRVGVWATDELEVALAATNELGG